MNSKYEIIIYWSNTDSAYIAEVPELPGCMADGVSYQEALSNAQTVIGQWLETAVSLGRTIPEARGRFLFA
ncbi:MAG: type II toxin-antitoxin system HicB family antitoxin [Polaromonas sp.]|nr:MAG: type II toxin-antitoxin system HicB family antitoxin [Polaromonas sp.]